MLVTRVAPSLLPLRRSANGCKMAGAAVVRSKSMSGHHPSSSCLPSTMMVSQQRQGGDNVASVVAGKNGDGRASTKQARRCFAGALASVVAASMLAREGLLPEVFFDWDNQVEWEEVHQLAQMSNITNKAHAVVQKRFESFGYRGGLVIRDLPEASTRYFVHTGHLPDREHGRVHHVAIRGTVSLHDVNIDFKTQLEFDKECGCVFHAGFKKVADAVASDIETFLEPGTPIKLTGHSLGGAVATILAAKLKVRGYTIGRVMTFGTPKITDTQGADRLDGFLPLLRVTHERDPVPLMPIARADWKVALADQEEITGTVLDAADFAAGYEEELVAGCGTGDVGDAAQAIVGTYPDKRRATSSTMAYAHFGSQVILVQRQGCMECWREQSSSTSSADVGFRGKGAAQSRLLVPWDDTWGPRLSSDVAEATESASERADCGHSPWRAHSYYDPHGDDGCTFDTAWARLSNMYYMHRMKSYEHEVSERRDKVLRQDPLASLGQERQRQQQQQQQQQPEAQVQQQQQQQPQEAVREQEWTHRGVRESKRVLAA